MILCLHLIQKNHIIRDPYENQQNLPILIGNTCTLHLKQHRALLKSAGKLFKLFQSYDINLNKLHSLRVNKTLYNYKQHCYHVFH